MKRWWIYIILYMAVGILDLPAFQDTDIAMLSPVQVVWAEITQGSVCLVTDGDDVGTGATVIEALEDMKATAAGTVFLDTADYLIVKGGSEELLEQVAGVLRPSCKVCVADAMPKLKAAAEYLSVHEPSVKLKDYKEKRLPFLLERAGRLVLVERENINAADDGVVDCGNQCTDP